MISLIWTSGRSPASKLIKALTKESVSHFAIEIDHRLVFHSNFYGAHLKWLTSFLRRSAVVYRIDLALTNEQEEMVYQRLINQFDEQPYDFGALAYWLISMLGYRYLGRPIPTRNLWGSSKSNLCVELAECLDVVGVRLPDLDMVLPERLYFILKEQLDGNLPVP